MRGGMLEPVCTSLVEMADKVSSDKKKKDLESKNVAVRLKHTVTGGSYYKLILHSRRKRQ